MADLEFGEGPPAVELANERPARYIEDSGASS